MSSMTIANNHRPNLTLSMTNSKSSSISNPRDNELNQFPDPTRQDTLSKEPNPFDQSFGKLSLIKEEADGTIPSKPTLPSLSAINHANFFPNDGPIKLSPMILDSKTYNYNQETQLPAYHPTNIMHPPIKGAFAPGLSNFLPPDSTNFPPTYQRQFRPDPFNPGLVQLQPSNITLPLAVPVQVQIPVPSPYIKQEDFLIHKNHMIDSRNVNMASGLMGNAPLMQSMDKYNITPMINQQDTKPRKGAGGRKRLPTVGMSDKKIDFLERNRKAALKCRQRKKNEIKQLEDNANFLVYSNNVLTNDVQLLAQEAMKLRALIANHSTCPIAQAAGVMGESTLPQPTHVVLPTTSNHPNRV